MLQGLQSRLKTLSFNFKRIHFIIFLQNVLLCPILISGKRWKCKEIEPIFLVINIYIVYVIYLCDDSITRGCSSDSNGVVFFLRGSISLGRQAVQLPLGSVEFFANQIQNSFKWENEISIIIILLKKTVNKANLTRFSPKLLDQSHTRKFSYFMYLSNYYENRSDSSCHSVTKLLLLQELCPQLVISKERQVKRIITRDPFFSSIWPIKARQTEASFKVLPVCFQRDKRQAPI